MKAVRKAVKFFARRINGEYGIIYFSCLCELDLPTTSYVRA